MAFTASTIVVLLDPSKTGDSRLADMIAYATEILDESVFGADYQQAIAYLTLHLYAMGTRGTTAAGGPIASEAEGALSRSYGIGMSSDTWSMTSWGQMLLDLQRKRTGSFITRRM